MILVWGMARERRRDRGGQVRGEGHRRRNRPPLVIVANRGVTVRARARRRDAVKKEGEPLLFGTGAASDEQKLAQHGHHGQAQSQERRQVVLFGLGFRRIH